MLNSKETKYWPKWVDRVLYFSPIWLSALSGILVARMLVTFDSALYLASAKAIFSEDMINLFHWIREPIYPIFLKAVLSLSNSGLLLALIQSLLLGLTLFYLLNQLPVNRIWRFATSITVFVSPIIIGFLGAVLQQILMASLLLLISAEFLRLIRKIKVTHAIQFKDAIPLILVLLIANLTTFFFAPLTFAVTSTLLVLLLLSTKTGGRKWKNLFPTLLTSLIPFAGLSLWWLFKFFQIGINRVPIGLASWPFQFGPEEIPQVNFFRKFLALAGVLPDAHTATQSNETVIFAIKSANESCGVIYDGPPSLDPYIAGYIEDSCRNDTIIQFISLSTPAAQLFFGLVILIGTISSFLVLFMKRFGISRFVVIAPLVFLMTYQFFALGISRYSVPTYPVFLAFIFFGIQWVIQKYLYRKKIHQGDKQT